MASGRASCAYRGQDSTPSCCLPWSDGMGARCNEPRLPRTKSMVSDAASASTHMSSKEVLRMNHEDYITLQHRLENWTRWARDFGGSVGHCASVEHWYRSPQHWFPEEPHVDLDLHDALKLERAIRG